MDAQAKKDLLEIITYAREHRWDRWKLADAILGYMVGESVTEIFAQPHLATVSG